MKRIDLSTLQVGDVHLMWCTECGPVGTLLEEEDGSIRRFAFEHLASHGCQGKTHESADYPPIPEENDS